MNTLNNLSIVEALYITGVLVCILFSLKEARGMSFRWCFICAVLAALWPGLLIIGAIGKLADLAANSEWSE